MDLLLGGKTVLVTGASKGIGYACALGFAAEGCNLHLASRNGAELESAREKILASHKVRVNCHALDLGLTDNVLKLAKTCADADILINNAGAIPSGRIDQIDDATWRHAWDLKVFGYINLTREIYAVMKARRAGVIVNVIGVAGERHRPEYIAGTTGNAGLIAFTRALGAESVDHHVRVVGINPGRVLTERQIGHMKESALRRFGDESRWEEALAEISKTLPFGRPARPDETADLVVYTASARASYLSGTVITLDGGQSLRARAT
jgi:3-oxoacyl-[acyl-carrier protein] reductase